MKKVLAGVLATLTLVSGTVTAGAADARDYRGRYDHRDHDNNDAIVAGIAGLAIGAALGSSYRGGGYAAPPRYYGNSYYGNGYHGGNGYGNGYYAPPPRYGYGYGYAPPPRYRETCRTVSLWDPYYGRYVRQRQCW